MTGIFVGFELVVVSGERVARAGLDEEEEVGVDVARAAAAVAAIFSILRFQTLTVGFAWAATMFNALTASCCCCCCCCCWPCFLGSSSPWTSNGADNGDEERVVARVTDEFGVSSALVVDIDVLAVDTAELALGLLLSPTTTATTTGGRWRADGGGAAMGDRMF